MTAKLKKFDAELVIAKAKTIALNAALNLLAAAAVWGITELINKQKEEAEQAKQLEEDIKNRRTASAEAAKSYQEESEALGDIVQKYASLVSSTDNVYSIRSNLIEIQDQLIAKYGDEASEIDLLNKSLAENLRIMRELDAESNEKFLRNNKRAIDEAQELFEQFSSDGTFYLKVDGTTDSDALSNINAINAAIKGALKERGLLLEDATKINNEFEQVDGYLYQDTGIYLDVSSGETREEQIKYLEQYIDAYDKAIEKVNGLYTDIAGYEWQQKMFENTRNQLLDLLTQLENADVILTQAGDSATKLKEIPQDIQESYDVAINQIQRLYQEINKSDASEALIYGNLLQIDDLKLSLAELIAQYPTLREQAEDAFSAMSANITSTIKSADELREAFIKSYNEVDKSILGDIDKLEKALTSLNSGEYLSWDDTQNIVWGLDKDNIITSIKEINGEYKLSADEIIALKDKIIAKQVEEVKADNAATRALIANNRRKISAYQEELDALGDESKLQGSYNYAERRRLTGLINELTDSNAAFGDKIKQNNLLISEYNRHLGDTSNIAKVLTAQINNLKDEVSKISDKAEGLLKAQEHVIDDIIDGLEKEQDAIEKDKEALEKQLEVLEEQKATLEETIEQYETVGNVVTSTIDKEIEQIEKRRKEIEDYYDELIDNLKKSNEEREDAIDLAQKLADLENARNNKVRVYDSARGWHYEVDQEALAKAQNELDAAQAEQEIKTLEAQKEAALSDYDLESGIDALKEYQEQWQDILSETSEAEDERLAKEILGEEWREKIRARDTETLNKFRTNFKVYNVQLTSLVNGEIATLKSSISAKDEELKAKKEQITVWNDYKKSIQDAASGIKDSLEDYTQYLSTVTVTESSNYTDREENLRNFVNNYKNLIDDMVSKNQQIESAANALDDLNNAFNNASYSAEAVNVGDIVGRGVSNILQSIADLVRKPFENIHITSPSDAFDFIHALKEMGSYSTGGVADYTGLAMVHGTQSKSETIFNAAQSKKLYEYINQTPNLVADMITKAGSIARTIPQSSVNTDNRSVVFQNPNIVLNGVQNPQEFARQMDNYAALALSESQVWK